MVMVTIVLTSCQKEEIEPSTTYYFKLITPSPSDSFETLIDFQPVQNNQEFTVKSGENVLILKKGEINTMIVCYHTSDWTIETENWEEQVTAIVVNPISWDDEIIFNKTME